MFTNNENNEFVNALHTASVQNRLLSFNSFDLLLFPLARSFPNTNYFVLQLGFVWFVTLEILFYNPANEISEQLPVNNARKRRQSRNVQWPTDWTHVNFQDSRRFDGSYAVAYLARIETCIVHVEGGYFQSRAQAPTVLSLSLQVLN